MAWVKRNRHGSVGLCAALAIAAAVLLGLALPAQALLAPHYYEQARKEAASVIVIAVRAVTPPSSAYGACQVHGRVQAVERGAAYAVGQDVSLAVPCRTAGAQPPLGGMIYQDVDALRATPFGRAYLDAQGALALSQYEPLKTWP
ncbi:hypothetical protein [Roseixanthobacter pseudopolyaromaticivorans]|uniref:hypothetical protein n=1 Tax=Xanthobacteraceae TaxID=335928 RepID=UPI00372B5CF6